MWMTDYIQAVKRDFRDVYGFKPSGGTKEEPLFERIPDGDYPMEIEGKTDHVKVENGKLHVARFK